MDSLLASLTTLRVGGPARRLVTAYSEPVIVETVREADRSGEPVLILGGGSNVLVSDGGFDGTVVHVATHGVDIVHADTSGSLLVRVAAGEPWDRFVARAVESDWAGVEALSGIPGTTGATPIQNVGAYGQEVAATVVRVRTYDRKTAEEQTFANVECGFGYRTSLFKGDDRHVVLDVTFRLSSGKLGEPVRYGELADALGIRSGERAELPHVRNAVLHLRAGKGMVLDEDDHDTWSAGSFFTNPVMAAEELPAGAPAWPQPDGRVKTSAAWLIERAGFPRGYPGKDSPVSLSTKHALALTNRGSGTAADLVALAREIRDKVRDRFAVTLEPEPTLIGVTL